MAENLCSSDSDAVIDLDVRQNEVLRRLDELNERIEAVIKEFAPPPCQENAGEAATPPAGDEPERKAA